MQLTFVRHGETDWNRQRRIQGSTDVPLNDTGRRQAREAARLLARRDWDAVVTSPLSRAFDTAAIIAEELGLPAPAGDARLVERAYGDAEGLEIAEVDRRYPGDTFVPGREERDAVTERALAALRDIAQRHPDQNVIVVSHGGLIRSLLVAAEPRTRHPAITNGSIHSFRLVGEGVELIRFDDRIDHEGPNDEGIAAQNRLEARESSLDTDTAQRRMTGP